MNRDDGIFNQGYNDSPTNVALPDFSELFTSQQSQWRMDSSCSCDDEPSAYMTAAESDSDLDEPESVEKLQNKPLVPFIDVGWLDIESLIVGPGRHSKRTLSCSPASPCKPKKKVFLLEKPNLETPLVFTWKRKRDARRNRKKGRNPTQPVLQVFTWRRTADTKPSYSKSSAIELSDLHKHCVLGEGQFGQVWMVSARQNSRTPYALKVQSKYELAEEQKIDFAVREKKIMSALDHPFIMDLVASYQDEHFIYMLMDLVQGGELWSRLHTSYADQQLLNVPSQVRMPEAHAKFYTLAVADAIGYLHREHRVVYRDLKPENILLDAAGYPKLIDFGLAKHIESEDELSYTMVGTPSYCAPEVVMAQGHNMSVDNWALGVLIYDMVAGYHPFLEDDDMEQMQLFQSIARVNYPSLPTDASDHVTDLIARLLVAGPKRRLGDDLVEHAWFKDLDLAALRRREVKAPWVPTIANPLDTSSFEDWSDLEDKTQQTYPALEAEEAAMFTDF